MILNIGPLSIKDLHPVLLLPELHPGLTYLVYSMAYSISYTLVVGFQSNNVHSQRTDLIIQRVAIDNI